MVASSVASFLSADPSWPGMYAGVPPYALPKIATLKRRGVAWAKNDNDPLLSLPAPAHPVTPRLNRMSAEEIMQNALEELVELCRGPRPTDVYKAQYWGMAGAHALLLNGLLHLYKTAPTIPREKGVEFAGYALQWVAAINHHQAWEENLYYPLFGFELDSAAIVSEHSMFTDGIERLEHYLTDCLPDGTKYGYGKVVKPHVLKYFEGHHVQDLIIAFVKPLTSHALHELDHLEPVKLRKTGLTKEAMKKIDKSSLQHMRTMPNSTFLVYNLRHAPKGSEYPPAAPFVKRVLAPYIYSLPYRKYWQFAPAAIEY